MAMTTVVGWMLAGIFFSTQNTLILAARGYQDDANDRLLATAIAMLVWACLTPVVLYVADLFPLRKSRRLRSVAILLPLTLLLAAIRTSFDSFLPVILEGVPMRILDDRNSVLSLFHTHLLFIVLLIGIANFIRLQREEANRKRAEARFRAELAQARLSRLRADLHPHFLFNALNSVAAVVHTHPDDAREMLHQLVDLLQRSLATSDAREVALGEELELISSYLGILKMRFGDRLTTAIELHDSSLRDAAVPPLLLQPLVENAIVHGVANRIESTRVTVLVEASGPWLRLQVSDTGPGCEPAATHRVNGVGIRNVRARLESLYATEQSLEFRREAGTFVAEVRIPHRMLHDRELRRTA